MSRFLSKLYWKIFAIFLVIIISLGGIYIFITAKTVISYFQETSQRLHADVARKIAEDTQPFINGAINKPAVEDLFHDVMILNPGAEIYLLNKEGHILTYSAPDSVVTQSAVSLAPIEKFLASNGSIFIEGDNPRHKGAKKVFSAARIETRGIHKGYIYVILGGDKYESVTSVLMNSYKLKIAVASIIFTVLAALLVGLAAFVFITRDLNKIIGHVKEFQKGNWGERIHLNSGGDLGLLARTFNNMADTIAANIENVKAMEQSRLELIANVSHDLRTPLAVIQGYAETLLLKKSSLSENEKEHFTGIVVKNASKLKKLVDELFELSKLEARAIVPNFEQFSIAELLLDNVMRYRILADEKGITIHTDIPKDTRLVYADVGLIDRVLQNLIDNALNFTPPKGTVIAGLKPMNGDIEVSIADNGVGIPPEKLPHIFERYTHAEYKGAGNAGIGLGLAIIKKILELHNTVVHVKSNVAEGSIFYFNLPVVKEKK